MEDDKVLAYIFCHVPTAPCRVSCAMSYQIDRKCMPWDTHVHGAPACNASIVKHLVCSFHHVWCNHAHHLWCRRWGLLLLPDFGWIQYLLFEFLGATKTYFERPLRGLWAPGCTPNLGVAHMYHTTKWSIRPPTKDSFRHKKCRTLENLYCIQCCRLSWVTFCKSVECILRIKITCGQRLSCNVRYRMHEQPCQLVMSNSNRRQYLSQIPACNTIGRRGIPPQRW